MKHVRTLAIPLLLSALLLTGCSSESLLERGIGMLDKLFSENVQPITSSPKPEEGSEPSPASDPESAISSGAEEPELSDVPSGAEEPVITDDPTHAVPAASDVQPSAEPEPSNTKQAEPDPVPEETAKDVTPSHTDVTFFNPGESIKYVPNGVTGVYACEYTSGNDKIATVDSKTGKVTAVGPGTTKVKMHVESNGQYDFECIVRCSWKEKEEDKKAEKPSGSTNNKTEQKPGTANQNDDEPVLPPSEPASSTASKPSEPAGSSALPVTASHSDATFFNPKESFRFLPKGAGDDAAVSYTTSDANVATVDGKTGKVTAVGPGTATITMTVDGGGTEYIFDCIVRCSW